MRTIFGSKLMEAEELRPHKHFEVLLSPNDLRRRIIAKGKTLVDEEVEEDLLSDDDDGGGGRDGRSAAVSTASEAGGGERRNRRGTLGQLTDFDPMKLAHLAQTTWRARAAARTTRHRGNSSTMLPLRAALARRLGAPLNNRASERDDGGPLSPPASAAPTASRRRSRSARTSRNRSTARSSRSANRRANGARARRGATAR